MSAESDDALETLREFIRGLEDDIQDLREAAKEPQTELADSRTEIDKLQARIEELEDELEDGSDPDALSEQVHEFLRSIHVLPEGLDFPLMIAPSYYRTGLYAAVQKDPEP